MEQHQRGPFYKLSYIKEGVNPDRPAKLLTGCLQYASVAALAVILQLLTRSSRFVVRALIVFLGGAMGTDLISIGDPVWFHLPWDYARGVVLYELVCWALLGMTTAAVCGGAARPVITGAPDAPSR